MLEKNKTQHKYTINITGTFTTEIIRNALEFWLEKVNLFAEVNFVGFNQVFQQLVNLSSEFNVRQNQFNCILIRLEDIVVTDHTNTKNGFLELKDAIVLNVHICGSNKLIVLFCPPSDNFLQSKNKVDESYLFETEIENLQNEFSNLIVIKSSELTIGYNLTEYYEPLGEKEGNIPYKDNFYAVAATLIVRKIHALMVAPVKAIVVDCDNTIWLGIAGEDGPKNVKIEKQEQALQKFLIDQNNRGVLICLCSKNIEKDIWDVFDLNHNMLLKREHIGFYKINWEPKSKNLMELSREINIGLDSLVFIDDNPIECEEVKANTPSVITIQKRFDTDSISYIANSWLFDRIKITDEDKKRASMYKMEANRSILKTQIKSYGDFIKELKIHIDIRAVTSKDVPRISQLTFRTNQFNFTTIRRSEEEIGKLLANPLNVLYSVSLKDRFGEYGIIGAMIAKSKEEALAVDTFLLSCRALGKGVEHEMISFLGKLAKQNNKSYLIIPFKKTEKNIVAENFIVKNFSSYGVSANGAKVYTIPVAAAVSFRFDPDRNNPDLNENTSETSIVVPEIIMDRNKFFDDIIKNYHQVSAITNAIYKTSSLRDNRKQMVNKVADFSDDMGASLLTIWQEVLDNPNIGINDNFFEIGGDSVFIPKIVIRLQKEFNITIQIVDIFQYPTVKLLAGFISSGKEDKPVILSTELTDIKKQKDQLGGNGSSLSNGIAIIGMSGRFPGAGNIDEYWQIISQGKETISRFTREELKAKGVSDELLDNPDYVYANGMIDGGDEFDSAFFGFTPLEANCMDPQHRIFLETSYEALENAGYDPENYDGLIGVFGGSGPDNYQFKNLSRQPETLKKFGELQIVTNNGKDYLTTYVSYKLNLKGPSMNIQTACSTSLVSVHVACLNLLTYQCDIALAGGAFIQVPRGKGYMYKQGEIFSKKGQCRPFDKDADGMLFGEGSGVVVLKRYEDAVRDNDTIWAVIRGTAINNDGSVKVGYMAPCVEGQSRAIARAQAFAGVVPEDISYIETHGTGTHMGDPIEIAALKKVFGQKSDNRQFCAIGSVKANIGHLDAAAGVAGLIKTVLALKNKQIPPSINFTLPNPELNMEQSPFYINTKLIDWETDGKSRIAGISSFGVGGTNAHCIVEESLSRNFYKSTKKYHPIVLSAKTKNALRQQQSNLKQFLNQTGGNIADVAFTLLVGRKKYKYRSALFCNNIDEAIIKLETPSEGIQTLEKPSLAFVFTGQGSQYKQMAKDLYNEFFEFKTVVDEAHSFLKNNYGLDILDVIYSKYNDNQINKTEYAQPVLFVIQYALYKLLDSFGVKPSVFIGHSIGEITAACITGLFSFKDALRIVAVRGKLMQAQKAGAMLSIQLSASEIKKIIPANVDLALINGPNVSVVSGDFKEIENFQGLVNDKFPGTPTTILATSHAFHSRMMDPVIENFKQELSDIQFGSIHIPFISNVTGFWADPNTVGNIDYWANHIRSTVNFVDGINELLKNKNTLFIEVGPGTSISTLLSQYSTENKKVISISTMRHPKKECNDLNVFLDALSQIWINGGDAVFTNYYHEDNRSRIPLPTYPFERRKHWIEPKNVLDFHLEQKMVTGIERDKDTNDTDLDFVPNTDLFFDRPELSNEYAVPENETQRQMITIWQELLGILNIGILDDFFDLGGHSLLASQIVNRINDQFKLKLPIEIIFKHSNIKELGAVVDEGNYSHQTAIAYQKIVGNANLPISDEQIRLWILSQFDKNPAYNIPFTYRIIGTLDEKLFVKALEEVITRNAILRGNIKIEDIDPALFIDTSKRFNINLLDFSSDLPQIKSEKIRAALQAIVQKVFDIENEPLYRIYLFKESDSETIFHMTVNHLVFDGWSWGIFLKELYQIYTNFISNTPISLSEPKYQYYEYAAWQKSQRPDNFYEKSLQYWTEKLRGHPTQINFPHDFKRKPKSSGLGARVYFSVPEELNRKLKVFSKKQGVTEFTTYISAFSLLLYKYGGDSDICIGIPVANRPNATLEKIIGFFVNTLVLRFNIDTKEPFVNFLARNKNMVLEALNYQELSFDQLVNALQPPRIVNINPVFQVMFSWLNSPRLPLEITQFKTERYPITDGVSPMDITVYITEEDGRIEGEMEFSTDIFTRETMVRFTENYLSLLHRIVDNPQCLVK
jgi:FkbH-like protein